MITNSDSIEKDDMAKFHIFDTTGKCTLKTLNLIVKKKKKVEIKSLSVCV